MLRLAGLLLAGASASVLVTAADAQTTAPVAPATSATVSEVIVTAQRRNQSMQQVPISIVALSASQLHRQGVGQSSELATAVPGLEFNPSAGSGASPFIRGVGTAVISVGFESPVAVYVDDVYVGAPPAGFFSLGSITSLEVLKGPQGTLFGRNATAGVIEVRTKTPSQQPSEDVQVGYGNYDTASGSLYLNAPLSSTLAINLAADGSDQRDGFGRDLTTGRAIHLGSNYDLLAKALWTPTDRTSVLLAATYTRSDTDLGLNAATIPGTLSSGGGVYVGRYNSTGGLPPDWSTNEQAGVSLKIDNDLGWARLVSISAATDDNYYYRVDQDGSAPFAVEGQLTAPTDTRSQEFHLASPPSSNPTWLLGLYYFYSKAAADPEVSTGSTQAPYLDTTTLDHRTLNSYSGFADGTYKWQDGLSLTLGARYTTDDYSLQSSKYHTDALIAGSVIDTSSTFSKFTYRAVVDYQINRDDMVYISNSSGFKSGGYNLTVPTGVPVAPEVLNATEAGFKTEWLDHRLRLNASAFHYDYTNLQITEVIVGGTITLNAGRARINGGEVDFEATPITNLDLTGGLSILDGKYTSFPAGPSYVPNPGACPPAPPPTPAQLTGGNRACAANLAGKQTVQSPPATLDLLATYTIPMSTGRLSLSASYYYNEGFYWDPANQVKQQAFSLVNSSVTWRPTGGHWDVSLWGKNLASTYYNTFAVLTSLRSQEAPAAPRTFGVTVGAHF